MSEGTSNHEGDKNPENSNVEETLKKLQADLEAERKSKERILEESKKYKEGYQTFKQKEEETKKQQQEREEARLKKEGQFNVLLEQRESTIKELEEQLNSIKNELGSRDQAITNFRKAAAFEKEIGGKLKKDSYWSHVDFDKIAINPETGEIDTHSLSTEANRFSEEFKELIDFGNVANLPNSSASGKGALSYEQWKRLPLAERKKRMKDVKR
jgi:DNA repair exonuclease SbcCD ATPase subunit